MVPLIGSRFNTEYAFAKINREAAEDVSEVCYLKDERAFIVTMRGSYKQYSIETQTPELVQSSMALLQVLNK